MLENKNGKLIILLCNVLAMFAISFFIGQYEELDYLLMVIMTIVLFVIGNLLAVIIHELGHLICGLISGYTFQSFRIFGLLIMKDKKGFKFYRLSLAGTGGQCIMVPPDFKEDKGVPYKLYNLGGVIFNFISAVLFYVIYKSSKSTLWQSVFFAMMVVSIMMGFTNGLPLNSDGMYNDGANVLAMAGNLEAQRSLWLQMKVNALTARNISLDKMDESWFRMPNDDELDNQMVAIEGTYYCNYLMDKRAFEQCEETISAFLNKKANILDLHRNLLKCDLIYCQLYLGRDKQQINELYDNELIGYMRRIGHYPSILRTKYLYYKFIVEDEKNAKIALKEFKQTIKIFPYKATAKKEKELIDIINEKEKEI